MCKDAKQTARVYRIVASCFVKASPTVEKAVSCYNADRLVASLPSFHSVQSSLAVRKFHAAGKECCERSHERVCENIWCLMSWQPKRNHSYVSSVDLPTDSICKNLVWWAVTREPRKQQNCQNWGVGAYLGMGACSGQYSTRWIYKQVSRLAVTGNQNQNTWLV